MIRIYYAINRTFNEAALSVSEQDKSQSSPLAALHELLQTLQYISPFPPHTSNSHVVSRGNTDWAFVFSSTFIK